jgi:hypothetical protein
METLKQISAFHVLETTGQRTFSRCFSSSFSHLLGGHISRQLLLFSTYALQPSRLIVRSGLDVPTLSTMRLHACQHARAPSGGRWNCVRKFCLNADFHVTFMDLLHPVKLRHGTDGFTSPPKDCVLRIFSP